MDSLVKALSGNSCEDEHDLVISCVKLSCFGMPKLWFYFLLWCADIISTYFQEMNWKLGCLLTVLHVKHHIWRPWLDLVLILIPAYMTVISRLSMKPFLQCFSFKITSLLRRGSTRCCFWRPQAWWAIVPSVIGIGIKSFVEKALHYYKIFRKGFFLIYYLL